MLTYRHARIGSLVSAFRRMLFAAGDYIWKVLRVEFFRRFHCCVGKIKYTLYYFMIAFTRLFLKYIRVHINSYQQSIN